MGSFASAAMLLMFSISLRSALTVCHHSTVAFLKVPMTFLGGLESPSMHLCIWRPRQHHGCINSWGQACVLVSDLRRLSLIRYHHRQQRWMNLSSNLHMYLVSFVYQPLTKSVAAEVDPHLSFFFVSFVPHFIYLGNTQKQVCFTTWRWMFSRTTLIPLSFLVTSMMFDRSSTNFDNAHNSRIMV